ncbi:ABC transporter [bacterium]|nr:MAG: ABC transporter [bacterium]
MDHALTLEHVVKSFGSFKAVDDISLAIPRGSVYGFLGPNGAGKTTTIRMIMNIIRPDVGEIRILGQPAGERVKDRTGYLPEERGVYKKMKVLELVAYFGTLKGMSAREARQRGEELLVGIGLGDWIARNCQDLSKGMQQKVQFVSTVIHGPELVILDEPFSGLDPVNTELLKDQILALRDHGATVLFSTHIMDQAEQLCDYVVLIDQGRKVLDGTLDEVKQSAGGEVVVLETRGAVPDLASLPMVAAVSDFGHHREIQLSDGASPDELLAALVGKTSIRRFEVRRPSLHEVFLRTVGRTAMSPDEETQDQAVAR